MRKNVGGWTFVRRAGIRSTLTRRKVREVKALLQKATKVGIEVELNLPDDRGRGCRGNDVTCGCVSIYPLASGEACYTACSKKGNCSIEVEYGCAGVDCVVFEPACSECDKFAVGCRACPSRQTKDTRPDAVRERIKTELEPTQFLGNLGRYGVLDVVQDGSLRNAGVEVVTVGRKVDFPSLQTMNERICTLCSDEEAFVDERCSIHYHMLAGYLESGNSYNPKRKSYGLPANGKEINISELESPVPEIVLANFHQLWRRFENAIIWMTSSGASNSHITRWVKFRQPMKKYSAIRHTMSRVIRDIKETGRQQGRYMMVNYNPMKIRDSATSKGHEEITRLHLEIRCPDGNLSPTAISAFAVLFHGMLIKAVELSEFGTLESGDKDYMEQARHIESLLLNNDGDYGGARTSNTRDLHMYLETLRGQANELVDLLNGYLSAHKGAYQVLKSLANAPCSTRLIGGQAWADIERDLKVEHEDDEKKALLTLVNTTSIVECQTLDEWVEEVVAETKMPEEKVAGQVKELIDSGDAYWSPVVGTLVRR